MTITRSPRTPVRQTSRSGPRWTVISPGGSPVTCRPSRKIIDSRNGQFLGEVPDPLQGSRWQPIEPTRDLVVSRLDDLGGFLDGPLPNLGIGVGERVLGGM
jgi:hypothetical protein